jgi:CHASE3 domain sensor protein
VRRPLQLFRSEPFVLELSESDSVRLQTIIDLSAEERAARRPRNTVIVTAIVLLLMSGIVASLLLLWSR